MKKQLSAEEQLGRKQLVCNEFVEELKEHILEFIQLSIARAYWKAWEDGYRYKGKERESDNINKE